jgi:type II secretory pathway pseudopilin PulG
MIKNDSGSSLLEVLVAMGILSITLVTILTLFQVSFVQNKDHLRKVVAINLAQQKLEEIRELSAVNVQDSTDTPLEINSVSYERQVLVDTTNPNYRDIRIQVSWQSAMKQDRVVEITTRKSS